MLKFLLLLIGCCVALWFILPEKGNTQAAPEKSQVEEKVEKKLPPCVQPQAEPGSLTDKLTQLPALSFQELESLKKGSAAQRKAFFAKHAQLLKASRDLQQCSTFGIQHIGDPREQLPYTSKFTQTVNLLLFSAHHQFECGNKKQSEQDAETALKIVKIYCAESSLLLEFWLAFKARSACLAFVKKIKWPQQKKAAYLARIPGRKELYSLVQRSLKEESKIVRFMYEWSACMEDAEAKETAILFKGISKERLEKLLEEGAAFILKSLDNNTLTKETVFNVGTPEENKILEYFFGGYKYLKARNFPLK